ncbi:hypothetical protein XENOCAPTIV_006279 [Xenoophorus captivus]|uniref:Adenylate kinase n=1 Tax=Xenoophorus captivus TaxID=1517983 RepID=A0ABV0RZ20_9TELE
MCYQAQAGWILDGFPYNITQAHMLEKALGGSERLWGITDKRREEDEQERTALMCDGWLEEQAAMLVNHHSMIIQLSEVAHHHIEAGAKLQYELVLVSKAFQGICLKFSGAALQHLSLCRI